MSLEEGKLDTNLINVLKFREEDDNKMEQENKCLNIKVCLVCIFFVSIVSFLLMFFLDKINI